MDKAPKGAGFIRELARVGCKTFLAPALVLGLVLSACQTNTAPPPPSPVVTVPERTPPTVNEQDKYFRLRGTLPGSSPVRVALLLPFSNGSPDTRAVADAIEKAAEMALFNSGNADIILMPRDDGGTPEGASAAAVKAIDEGAEIILGPLLAQSALAVAPVAATKHVPVISFSSDRSAGGHGVYLLSFQPETEVDRIVSYAAKSGRSSFAALIPQSAYGDKVAGEFRIAVTQARGKVAALETYPARTELIATPVANVAKANPDAVLIADGGTMLRALAPTLALAGVSNRTAKFLGTGLWADTSILREPMLNEGWFAGPTPGAWENFAARFQQVYGSVPPRIASLGYDAMSLVVLLAKGAPYARYTNAALTNPNGFSGIDGIFRFREDGAAERGLAILQVNPDGVTVVDPAPTTFRAAAGL